MRAKCKLIYGTAWLMAVSFVVGCGGVDDAPEVAPVSGTVTLGGEPLPGAMVKFIPQQEGGVPSFGRTDENGWYELIYSRAENGAMLGEHRVEISTFEPGDAGGDYGDLDSVAYVAETVPAQYNVNSELARTVEADENTHDFDLEAEGEIIEAREDQ